jgi:hypothetical protein
MRPLLLLLLLAIAGCGGGPATPPGTGAREAAAAFFEAIARQDWNAAFDKIHGDSRKGLTLIEFSTRAGNYRKALGFELEKVHVRLCEEQGDKANAHLVLSDANDSRTNSFREAMLLRKEHDEWRIVVPPSFGAKR